MTACVQRVSPVSGKDTVVVRAGESRWEIARAAAEALRLGPGVFLTPDLRRRLEAAGARRAAAARALRALRRRPRTEFEVRRELERAGFAPEITASVLAELRLASLVDDARWARWYVAARLAARPAGTAALVREMRARGVPRDIAEAASRTAPHAEIQRARGAARKRLPALRGLTRARAAGRLARFLAGRGFDADTVDAVCDELLGTAGED